MNRAGALLLLLLAVGSAPAGAQDTPVLRFGDGSTVAGMRVQRAACFPAGALASLGARVEADAGSARIVIFGDTITLQATSPFIRARRGTAQLAQPVSTMEGALCIPEQFFVQWLPQQYPERVQYRDGVLHVAGGQSPTPPRAEAAAPRTGAKPAGSGRVVIIDPGHGGPDTGRIGPNGLREKEAVLLISTRLAAVLRERGYEVHLTRTRDTLIALADRPHLANQWKGDRPVALFLSIHANAVDRGKAQGFETFFLSDARTEDERRVAEMENAAVAYEEGTQSHGSDFEQLLNSLRNDFYVRASSDLATVVQDQLASFHPGPNRGVKRAGFRVLVGAVMPAVLIEVAFISDREEARALGTAAFQQKLAYGIAEAVDAFFARNEHLWMSGGS